MFILLTIVDWSETDIPYNNSFPETVFASATTQIINVISSKINFVLTKSFVVVTLLIRFFHMLIIML